MDRSPPSGHLPEDFRRAAGRFPTGVTVLTCVRNGEPQGMTVNAFATASLDPLLVLVVLGNKSQTARQVLDGDGFAVTVLSSAQEEVAQVFANGSRARDRAAFGSVPSWPAQRTGSPVLAEGVAYFDCVHKANYSAGDHTILLGAVQAFGVLSDKPALLFSRSLLGAEPDLGRR
ncbi:flavin reductase family protein [Micromonospora purpureochromogenes]|uniref:flavin reductase family protein n=1 Tax=Micromonospora purpureochromogenes TaxID=47872 RepID=UPI0034104CEF